MKSLVLAEKPSVARDIARVLKCGKKLNGALEGDKYVVTWALGHLVTLADPEEYDKKYKEWKMEDLPMMPKKMELVVIKQTAKQYQTVKTQLFRKDVGEIIIATDAGREGELVARWILEKANCRIPMMAGLGGGSADGAGVLAGLDLLTGAGCSLEQLESIGLAIGADIPFCLRGGTQRAQGIGEDFSPLPPMPDCPIVIIKPRFGISTKAAFARCDRLAARLQIPSLCTCRCAEDDRCTVHRQNRSHRRCHAERL